MSSRKKAQEKYGEKMPVLGIRIERDIKEDIERLADEEGITASDWIRKTLKNEIERIAKNEDAIGSKWIRKALKKIVNYRLL